MHGEYERSTPDFLVIGAQKSGTTTLFALLRKHPQIYLPVQKEVQFFSNDSLYAKGVDWYWKENFGPSTATQVTGEISPQYMGSSVVPVRIRHAAPKVKLIAILRHPLKRAFSQYQMSVRRQQEDRDFRTALESSTAFGLTDEHLLESRAYFQYSNYARILGEYLCHFPREQMLILFQEDLERNPEDVLRRIYAFLGVDPILPANPRLRLHEAGTVRFPWLNDIVRQPNALKPLLKRALPSRIRSGMRFWIEQFNIVKSIPQTVPADVMQDFDWIVDEQNVFLRTYFGVAPPWGNKSS